MGKKKKGSKSKTSTLNKMQKRVVAYAQDVTTSNVLIGIAGGAILSGALFAALKSPTVRNFIKDLSGNKESPKEN